MAGDTVQLFVYDITNGLAAQFSPMMLGRLVEGVWHTGVVVDGQEFFFGGGVQQCPAGQTPFGAPVKRIPLGVTELSRDVRADLIRDLSARFQPQHYHLVNNNCNHFSNELVLLLTGNSIPNDILNQAQELMASPLGQMVMPMFAQMESQLGGVTAQGFPGASPTQHR